MLFTAGTHDPDIPDGVLDIIVAKIGGPVKLELFEGAGHQLVFFNTEEYSSRAHAFCLENS